MTENGGINMKKALLLLCAASIAASLAACADKAEENDKVIPDGVDDEIETPADDTKTEEQDDETEENLLFDPQGSHFAGRWVNDSGTSAELQIVGDGTEPFQVIARVYETPTEFYQYEIVADHAVSTDGSSGLLVTDYQRYKIMDLGGGMFEITTIPGKIDEMLLVYDNTSSPGMEYVTWFYTEDDSDIITFIRTDTDDYMLPVEKIRN